MDATIVCARLVGNVVMDDSSGSPLRDNPVTPTTSTTATNAHAHAHAAHSPTQCPLTLPLPSPLLTHTSPPPHTHTPSLPSPHPTQEARSRLIDLYSASPNNTFPALPGHNIMDSPYSKFEAGLRRIMWSARDKCLVMASGGGTGAGSRSEYGPHRLGKDLLAVAQELMRRRVEREGQEGMVAGVLGRKGKKKKKARVVSGGAGSVWFVVTCVVSAGGALRTL